MRSHVSSPREKFFNGSFNGPRQYTNEPYESKNSELTEERIKSQPFTNIKSKIDRVRVNLGGSALSSGTSSANAALNLAVRPFARSAFGHQMMEEQTQHHKLNFNYGKDAKLGPSEKSINLMRRQEAQMR